MRAETPRAASLLAEINSQERLQKEIESNLELRRLIREHDRISEDLAALRERIGAQGSEHCVYVVYVCVCVCVCVTCTA